MNQLHYTSSKLKNKHLSYYDLKYIEREYNHFIKTKDKNQSKTAFMSELANAVHKCLSNLYNVIKSGLVELLNSNLTIRIEFSADIAYRKTQIIYIF